MSSWCWISAEAGLDHGSWIGTATVWLRVPTVPRSGDTLAGNGGRKFKKKIFIYVFIYIYIQKWESEEWSIISSLRRSWPAIRGWWSSRLKDFLTFLFTNEEVWDNTDEFQVNFSVSLYSVTTSGSSRIVIRGSVTNAAEHGRVIFRSRSVRSDQLSERRWSHYAEERGSRVCRKENPP